MYAQGLLYHEFEELKLHKLHQKNFKTQGEDVDVFVTLECIHLCILCLVPLCLFLDVSII